MLLSGSSSGYQGLFQWVQRLTIKELYLSFDNDLKSRVEPCGDYQELTGIEFDFEG